MSLWQVELALFGSDVTDQVKRLVMEFPFDRLRSLRSAHPDTVVSVRVLLISVVGVHSLWFDREVLDQLHTHGVTIEVTCTD